MNRQIEAVSALDKARVLLDSIDDKPLRELSKTLDEITRWVDHAKREVEAYPR